MSNQTNHYPGQLPNSDFPNSPYFTVSTESKNIQVPWGIFPEVEASKTITVADAMSVLKKAMKENPGYAWSWHCNIAMAVYDEGVNHSTANRAASTFMERCFDVETKYPEEV